MHAVNIQKFFLIKCIHSQLYSNRNRQQADVRVTESLGVKQQQTAANVWLYIYNNSAYAALLMQLVTYKNFKPNSLTNSLSLRRLCSAAV